jgi:hypothetical protein
VVGESDDEEDTMIRTQIVNQEGSTEQWAADVLHGGVFAARLSVSTAGGVQAVRLRRFDAEGKASGRPVAETVSLKGHPLSLDDISDFVDDAMERIPDIAREYAAYVTTVDGYGDLDIEVFELEIGPDGEPTGCNVGGALLVLPWVDGMDVVAALRAHGWMHCPSTDDSGTADYGYALAVRREEV